MRIWTVFLTSVLALVYSLGLTYATLTQATFTGLELFLLLLLTGVTSGVFALRFMSSFGTAFLVLLNASQFFALYALTASLLNLFNLAIIPLSDLGPVIRVFPFSVYAILYAVYAFGFTNRKVRYFVFSWVKPSQVRETHL